MDWLDRMNRAMDYIEANLADEISFDKAAQIACCSTYNFQRMFSYIIEVPLSEYIRRRRLTLAAVELQTSNIKVIDVALKYGYESPEAFSRAFKLLHGVVPTSARDIGVTLKAYPKMAFSLSDKSVEVNCRIEQRKDFEVFGVYRIMNNDMEKAFIEIPAFLKKCSENSAASRINKFLGRPDDALLHSALFDFGGEKFKYMICCYTPQKAAIPDEFTKLTVPASTWAVFYEQGNDLESLYRNIYTEWFPRTEYDLEDGPRFEMRYGIAGHPAVSEIWIPVRKNKGAVSK